MCSVLMRSWGTLIPFCKSGLTAPGTSRGAVTFELRSLTLHTKSGQARATHDPSLASFSTSLIFSHTGILIYTHFSTIKYLYLLLKVGSRTPSCICNHSFPARILFFLQISHRTPARLTRDVFDGIICSTSGCPSSQIIQVKVAK